MSDETKKGTAKSPGEFELITRLKTKLQTNDSVIVGAGDDCAVIDASVPGKWQLPANGKPAGPSKWQLPVSVKP